MPISIRLSTCLTISPFLQYPLETAIASRIFQGDKIDAKKINSVNTNVGFQAGFNSSGFSVGMKVERQAYSEETYKMRD